MQKSGVWVSLILSQVVAFGAIASDQVGTLTQVDGEVKLYTDASKKLPASGGATVLYEGEYYTVRDAKAGDKVERGYIVKSSLTSKARVVYDNGDQFAVGPGTAYKIQWDKDTANTSTQVNLMYGKLRGIVEKGGPRSKLQIKTRTAIMGVRGTDFFIASGGNDNGTEISIIRGAVEVKPEGVKATADKPVKSVEVKAGFSAEVPKAAAVVPSVELRKTTQEELVGIQKVSEVKRAASEPAPSAAIQKLEKKAIETTMQDIKKTDVKLFQEIQKNPSLSSDEVNAKAVQKLLTVAPKAPEKRKPYRSELEDLETGAYEKYFRNVN